MTDLRIKAAFRPESRLVKLRPGIFKSKRGVVPMVGTDYQTRWWSDGNVIWKDTILDPSSQKMAQDNHRILRDEMPIDLFWPKNARLKLRYVGDIVARGHGDFAVYQALDKSIVRFVPDHARPPKFLFASSRARGEPFQFLGEVDDARDRIVGRLRPSESERNDALVDHQSAEKANLLVVPRALPREDVEAQLVGLGLMDKSEVKSQEADAELKEQEATEERRADSGLVAPVNERIMDVPDYKMGNLERSFKKLVKAAQRLGVLPPEMFVLQDVEIKMPPAEEGGKSYSVAGKQVQLYMPEVIKQPGDFQVLAKLEQVGPGSNLVHVFTKDDPNLDPSVRTADMICEHCGKARRRKGVFIVEDMASGERKQIGSACLDDFTGHPGMESLCNAAADYSKLFGTVDEDLFNEDEGGVPWASILMPPVDILATTAVVIRENGFVPRSKAGGMRQPTADLVTMALQAEMKGGNPKNRVDVSAADRRLAEEAVEWAKDMQAVSDYEQNIKALASLGAAPVKHVGFLASIIPTYQRSSGEVLRQKERQKQKDEAAGKQVRSVDPYLPGNVGDRVYFKAKLVDTKVFEGRYGNTYFYKFQDADDRIIVWRASKPAEVDQEPRSFQDVVQTTLERVEDWGPDYKQPIGTLETVADAQKYLLANPPTDPYLPYREFQKELALPIDQMPWDTTDFVERYVGSQRYWTKAEVQAELKKPESAMDKGVRAWLQSGQRVEPKAIEVGGTYQVKGTIKKKEPYRDVPQTEVTRCKVIKEMPVSYVSARLNDAIASRLDDVAEAVLPLTVPDDVKLLLAQAAELAASNAASLKRHRSFMVDILWSPGASRYPPDQLGGFHKKAFEDLKKQGLVVFDKDLDNYRLTQQGLGYLMTLDKDVESAVQRGMYPKEAVVSGSKKQENQVLTTLFWVGKKGTQLDLSQRVLDRLVADGSIRAIKNGYKLTKKGVERFRAISKKRADLVDRGVRDHGQEVTAAADRNHGMCVTINLPQGSASKFPDKDQYNNGHQPHVTVCFITADDVSPGQATAIQAAVRRALQKVPPMRLRADFAQGLQTFGPGQDGKQALWLPIQSDPDRDALPYMHRVIRTALELEGLPCQHHDSFKGHLTWAYVSNDLVKDVQDRMSAVAAARFPDGLAFDVHSVQLSFPDGTEKTMVLNPALGKRR